MSTSPSGSKTGSSFSTCPYCTEQLYWDHHTDQWLHNITGLPIGHCNPPEESIDFNEGQAEADDDEIARDRL